MNTWNIVLLVLNVVFFILIAGKIAQFYNIYQDNLQVQQNIESLVEQNSRLVDLILDELEGKIREARSIAAGLEAQSKSAATPKEPQPLREHEPVVRNQLSIGDLLAAQPVPQMQEAVDESLWDFSSAAARSKIIYMRQMGMSVQEIAEKLQISQGEIDLKLNFEKRKSSKNRVLRKLK